MTDWWRALEEELDRRGDEAPDPWGAIEVSADDVTLTPDQRAFLEQVASTPLHGIDDESDAPDFDTGPADDSA